MFPVRTILLATDFSETATAAIQVARSLAQDYGARLVLLHVVPFETIPSEVLVLPTDLGPYEEETRKLARSLEGSDMKFGVEPLVREGDPGLEILRAAAETASDLIVVGSHGRSGLSRLLMGSVAEMVMRQAACPVLVVKAKAAVKARPAQVAQPASAN